jgi:hypothetical protein
MFSISVNLCHVWLNWGQLGPHGHLAFNLPRSAVQVEARTPMSLTQLCRWSGEGL